MPKKVPPSSPFAERLVELRKARRLTQTQLAEMIGSTQRALSRYETVAEYPPAPVLVALAKALGVSADELLGLKPIKAAKAKQDPEERRVWKTFQMVLSLPEKDRRAVVRLVRSLVAGKRDAA